MTSGSGRAQNSARADSAEGRIDGQTVTMIASQMIGAHAVWVVQRVTMSCRDMVLTETCKLTEALNSRDNTVPGGQHLSCPSHSPCLTASVISRKYKAPVDHRKSLH